MAAGVLLLLGIVLWDRLRRPASRADDAPRSDDRARPIQQRAVPQLEEALAVRPRVREPASPPIVAGAASRFDSDALPPMHAVEPANELTSELTSELTNELTGRTRPEPAVDRLSTGAFIAAQALSTQSMRAAMHDAQRDHTGEAARSPLRESVQADTVSMPSDDAPSTVELPATHASSIGAARASSAAKRVPASRKIVALRLSAGPNKVEGSRLKSLLDEVGLKHGKYGIYHRLSDDGATLFSVASMVEPGTFDPYAMAGVQFPGVTLFMQLPGALPGDEAFTQMLTCARRLEDAIEGELRDERGVAMNAVREQRVRDEIADFEHLLGRPHA